MTTLQPYLFFGGRCEQALELYCEALSGRVRTLMRLGDVNPEVADEHKRWIIHSELEVDGRVLLMAGDGMPSAPRPEGAGSVSLALGCEDKAHIERVLAALRDGGDVLVEPHDTFYGGHMAVVKDRYGMSWMLEWSPRPSA